MGRITRELREPAVLQNTDIDTAAEQLSTSDLPCGGCNVKALPGNTGVVYVGFDNTVTSTTGWPLSAGEETGWMPWVANINQVWVIASVNDQGAAAIYAE